MLKKFYLVVKFENRISEKALTVLTSGSAHPQCHLMSNGIPMKPKHHSALIPIRSDFGGKRRLEPPKLWLFAACLHQNTIQPLTDQCKYSSQIAKYFVCMDVLKPKISSCGLCTLLQRLKITSSLI